MMEKLTIAIAGGIGSGKTTVANCFKALNIEVIQADKVAQEIRQMPTNQEAIIAHFGSSVLNQNHQIDKVKLRRVIFSDISNKQWLEALLHPQIRAQILSKISASISPYVMVEIPIFSSRTQFPYIDRLLFVASDKVTRVNRVIQRDSSLTKEQVFRIIQQQTPDELIAQQADDIIENTGSIEQLKDNCLKLHNKYVEACTNNS